MIVWCTLDPSNMDWFAVGMGGFFGAITRYLVYLAERSIGVFGFPVATLFINTLGCLLAGILSSYIEQALPTHRNFILFGSIGFLGSFTTFSTFGLETASLLRTHHFFAFLNVITHILFGIGAIFLGKSMLSR